MRIFKILHVVASVDPALGGIAESIRCRGSFLQSLGHIVHVVCMDEPTQLFVKHHPLSVFALGPGLSSWKYQPRLVDWLKKHYKDYDAIVVDGIWQYHSYAIWKVLHGTRVPYFVFTHGMLDPWFKTSFPLKHFKKQLFWPWSEFRLLRDAKAVLFTCAEEERLAKLSFSSYRVNPEIVPFGGSQPPESLDDLAEDFRREYPILEGRRMLLFLGRVHEKKGCDILIEAFSRIAKEHKSIVLGIAGPGTDALVTELKSLATKLGVSNKIMWFGMLNGTRKWGALAASFGFVLPSHQENFGISVVEALACGKPVVISNKVNIWSEIKSANAGFVGEDNVDDTWSSLDALLALNPVDLCEMSSRGVELYRRSFSVESMANGLIAVLERNT